MQPEIEAKFLNVDFEDMRKKLRASGATCTHPMRLMRRKNFDRPNHEFERTLNAWVRVRDEGNRVTLAYKQLNHRGIDGTQEVSVEVDSFDDTVSLLQAIGLEQTSYQETRRESWELDGVQIELDEWPWAHPYIEIEASAEKDLYVVAEKLGFEKEQALHGSVEIVYMQEYNVSEKEVDAWPEITFVPVPAWLEEKRR